MPVREYYTVDRSPEEVAAVSDYSERNDVPDAPAWEGLFYFTQDLLDISSALMKKTA